MSLVFQVLAMAFSVPCFAYDPNPVNDPAKLLRQEQEREQFRNLPQSIPAPAKLDKDSVKKTDQAKIFVKEFRIQGELKITSENELLALLSDFTDKELTFSQIQEAATKVTNFYANKGYFLLTRLFPNKK